MSIPATINRILDNLDKRKSHAEIVLSKFAESTDLPKLLGASMSWAIVGGAVRDCILAEGEEYLQTLFIPWPDVDIAVADNTFNLTDANIGDSQGHLTRNSFGGWKASLSSGAELDIWRIPAPSNNLPQQLWHDYLKSIDFSINAVAFIWPQRIIVMHPQWPTALKKRHVEKLSLNSPRQELQPIRAIALCAKLKLLTGCKFNLGKSINHDLAWLLSDSQTKQRKEAFEYLKNKTCSGRWSQQAITSYLRSTNITSRHPFLFQYLAKALKISI